MTAIEPTTTPVVPAHGDVDLAPVAALVGDPGRARVLVALADGRALPASVLASEAGVSPSTASAHLAKLVDGGLLTVERHGRNRYYRLANRRVGALIETLASLSPTRPVRSLREGNRAHALREGRTCYDHLAGRLGVALMRGLIECGVLAGGDGMFHPDDGGGDRLSAPGHATDYLLTTGGAALLAEVGVRVPEGRRPLIRYCVDWSEQRHHLAGRLGAALLTHALESGWVRRAPAPGRRSVRVTDEGRAALRAHFGVELPPAPDAGAPSTGAPSTGAPSTGAPSTTATHARTTTRSS
ncbi:ArsR/SmtB family transcription factor [Streptomyces montanisoli]|uniref:Helix-turn-helix transcriptional regulator n=1 Tax=Streptomyces montanisoli TaxID=2798581 RepID=A0A940S047_9ACTN|nr:helix-turn-helix transcriptional regulator [Streptomyces montanisoli]MBP0460479.1 helix-turn-helix transcriptional regulator [Streptomyces montanisoli]